MPELWQRHLPAGGRCVLLQSKTPVLGLSQRTDAA
jgi:hypothetical protein